MSIGYHYYVVKYNRTSYEIIHAAVSVCKPSAAILLKCAMGGAVRSAIA
ncbi:hypothetical protein [Anabaena azotica]|uniref:Uncharacterized protein n=1 Tax=Anabaena azotica FACHB-119 TaxID=947527 RepID=A0ABR8DAG4_9NOST|nr:hypothetical protein [Anabaena azotica]MBD2504198.1 hypothetical protein [Anabaena azotica FACHB-119]